MFWYFAFAAVIVWLLYLALGQRIDSAMEQLRQNIVADVGALSHRPELSAKEDPADDLDARVRKQIYKDFPRYGIHDAYTVSELLRSYEREDSRGRIRLLRRVYAQGCLRKRPHTTPRRGTRVLVKETCLSGLGKILTHSFARHCVRIQKESPVGYSPWASISGLRSLVAAFHLNVLP